MSKSEIFMLDVVSTIYCGNCSVQRKNSASLWKDTTSDRLYSEIQTCSTNKYEFIETRSIYKCNN